MYTSPQWPSQLCKVAPFWGSPLDTRLSGRKGNFAWTSEFFSLLIVIFEHKTAKLVFLGAIMTYYLFSFWQNSWFVVGAGITKPRSQYSRLGKVQWILTLWVQSSFLHSFTMWNWYKLPCLSVRTGVSRVHESLLLPVCCLGSKATSGKRKPLGKEMQVGCWESGWNTLKKKNEELWAGVVNHGGSLHSSTWVSRKTNLMMRGLALWVSPTFREGIVAAGEIQLLGQWFNQSWLYNETPIKTLETEAQWCFLIGEHFDVPGQ